MSLSAVDNKFCYKKNAGTVLTVIIITTKIGLFAGETYHPSKYFLRIRQQLLELWKISKTALYIDFISQHSAANTETHTNDKRSKKN